MNITGKITATEGKIGKVIIGTDGSISNGNFKVTSGGKLEASGVDIIGKITATSGSFTGTVYASAGSFTGTVNASDGVFNGAITVKDALKFNGTNGKITFSKDSSAYIRYVDDDTTKAIVIYGKDIKITGTSSLILGSTTISGGLNVTGTATIQGGQITVQKSNTETAAITLTYAQLKALQELADYSTTLQGLAQTTRKSGSFKDANNKTITVTNGFISNIPS